MSNRSTKRNVSKAMTSKNSAPSPHSEHVLRSAMKRKSEVSKAVTSKKPKPATGSISQHVLRLASKRNSVVFKAVTSKKQKPAPASTSHRVLRSASKRKSEDEEKTITEPVISVRPCLMFMMWSHAPLALFMAIFMRCAYAEPLPRCLDIDQPTFNNGTRCTMRAFTDPHIETCNDPGTSVPCNAVGMQTYLNIFFLKVTAVHTTWRPRISILSEIIIDFSALADPHDVTYTYRASGGNLPTVFEFEAAPRAVIDTVIMHHMGRTVELIWPFTGITIQISHWRNIYSFTMRGAKDVMNTGSGMLIDGCPVDQIYVRGIQNANRLEVTEADAEAVAEADAEAACLKNNVPADSPDMETCKFDVIATGDTAIARATAMSIEDRRRAESMDCELIHSSGVRPIEECPAWGNWTAWSDWDVVKGADPCIERRTHTRTRGYPCERVESGQEDRACCSSCSGDVRTQVRLVGGSNSGQGRLQVYHSGRWGTVCGDSWNDNGARVICRMLGLYSGGTAVRSAEFGPGSSTIWLDNVQCTGDEADISCCDHNDWGSHSCTHKDDVGVMCDACPPWTEWSTSNKWVQVVRRSDPCIQTLTRTRTRASPCKDVETEREERPCRCSAGRWGQNCAMHCNVNCLRNICEEEDGTCKYGCEQGWQGLICDKAVTIRLGGGTLSEGRVELYYLAMWGTVCDDGWDDNDARVVCRMLGYSGGTAVCCGQFGAGAGVIWLDDVNCSGTEEDIADCPHRRWGAHNCWHAKDAGVRCYGKLESDDVDIDMAV